MTFSSNNIDFINSINRIVNIDINNTSNLNKFNNVDDYFDINNISSTNDENSSSTNSNNNTFSKEEEGDNVDSDGLNDEANSLSNRIADLTELDNLLDDLYNAKKSLAASNSLNHNMVTDGKLEPPTINIINDKEKISRNSLNDSTRTSTSSSSSPTSLKSNLNQYVSSGSSTTSSSIYYNQFVNSYNTNNYHSSFHNPNGSLSTNNNSFNYSIEKDNQLKQRIPSSSSSSCTASSYLLNDNSKTTNTNLINTRKSVEKLMNSIDQNNLVINRSFNLSYF